MPADDVTEHSALESWRVSRAGAWAGRGFHYQHLFSTLILIRQWAGLAPSGFLVPEGFQDCVVEFTGHDVWVQIKSRKEGPFRKTEAQKILASVEAKAAGAKRSSSIQSAVILEQPCSGISEVGIDQLFAGTAQGVFVCASPGDESVKLLTAQLNTAEVIADGIVSDLYRMVADASQANASLSFEKRRRISTSEIERRIFERLEAEDPSAIDHAFASGALEPIDFRSPVDEPAFYQGVKVTPGHVAAGLVQDRPDDTENVITSLRRRRHVLVSGPSGAGKSALMWLSAGILAGELRWHQITVRAVVADANAIIRFIRARRPTETSPIGLAFDDIGSANSDLWDVLVRELRGTSSVYFLGSIRQEDVALIANQADTEFIAVDLDENLAEGVWQNLRAEKQTSWEHWREPFEKSEGLMLEYVHLLTQGTRLAVVINEQVRQRQREGRDDELAIIRITSALCASGGEVQVNKLIELLEIEPDAVSRALARLLDEHLVREIRPGVLGGLHMLRSKALSKASHDEAVFLATNSLWESLPAATNETLPRVIQSVLAGGSEGDEETVLNKLAETLSTGQNIDTWSSILTGLGLATLERGVDSFISILGQHNVQRAQWSLASMFSDPQIDIPEFTGLEQWQNLRGAVLAFRALPKHDLRRTCLEYLPDGTIVPSCQNLQQANKFLSCLAPIGGGEAVRLTISPNFVVGGEQEIRQVAALLSTAYLIGQDVAENLTEAFGGEQVLFKWFRSQTPWTTMPVVDPNGAHGRTVRADWFYVSEHDQPDPHETVCSICETLVAISPMSNAAAADAIDPQGLPIMVGDFRPWSKNMPRQNIAAKTRVAWNVAFRQILLTRSASDSLTDYTRKMTVLVKQTEKVFRSFTEKWIKGKTIANADALAETINGIVRDVNALAYAMPEKLAPEMTTPVKGAGEDDSLGALLTGVLGNLLRRMNKIPGEENAKAVAVFAGSLAAQAQNHEQSTIWRTSTEPPLRELGALAERLSDVACISHEMAHDDNQSAIQTIIQSARKSSLSKAIRAAARYCRSHADQRFQNKLKALVDGLKDKGRNAQCWTLPIRKTDSTNWPAQEVAILVEIENFETDASYLEDSFAMGQMHLANDWRFRIVPVINGQILASLALVPSPKMLLLDRDFATKWREYIDRPFLTSQIAERFDEALAACDQVSAIVACRDMKHLHADEDTALSRAVNAFERNNDLVNKAAIITGSEHLTWVHDYLNETWNLVVSEFEAAKSGQKVTEPLCLNSYSALSGQTSDQSTEIATARILILQAECSSVAESINNQTP